MKSLTCGKIVTARGTVASARYEHFSIFRLLFLEIWSTQNKILNSPKDTNGWTVISAGDVLPKAGISYVHEAQF